MYPGLFDLDWALEHPLLLFTSKDLLLGLSCRRSLLVAHVSVALHITEISIEDEFLVIELAEKEPENDGEDTTGDGRSEEDPDKVGIRDGGSGSQTDDSRNGIAEEVEGRHQTLHVLGSHGVGDAVQRDVDEYLGKGADDDRDGIETVWDGRQGRLA